MPRRRNSGPHTIDPNKAMIQSVHYENGSIGAVQFQNGQVVDVQTAIEMTEADLIEDANTGVNRLCQYINTIVIGSFGAFIAAEK
jgi:hypothetical protein